MSRRFCTIQPPAQAGGRFLGEPFLQESSAPGGRSSTRASGDVRSPGTDSMVQERPLPAAVRGIVSDSRWLSSRTGRCAGFSVEKIGSVEVAVSGYAATDAALATAPRQPYNPIGRRTSRTGKADPKLALQHRFWGQGTMATGRTIRIFLVDGTPSGMLTAEIINWTGQVIVAGCSQVADLARRTDIRRTGLYCLVGPDPEQSGRDRVYVGEADNVYKRLVSHDRDESKDFWTRAVAVISKDTNITKSHGRYLESRVINMTRQAGRANLDNNTSPETPTLPESDIADMEYFLEQVRIVFPVLGMSFLQPQPVVSGRPSLYALTLRILKFQLSVLMQTR